MLRFAFRNLFHKKAYFLASVGGMALALMLILSLDAIVNGIQAKITTYIDHSGADIFVSQPGVRNMHMASSTLPLTVLDQVRSVEGVESVTPIRYLGNIIAAGDDRYPAYVIGLPKDAQAGGPWRITQGVAIPKDGEIIIDRGIADAIGIGLGDSVSILSKEFRIAGLSEGTDTFINSVVFISFDDFAQLRGNTEAISFVLVKVKAGESPTAVADRIRANVGDVNVQLQAEFATQERRVVGDMSTDIVTIMNLIGFLIGLAVMALTIYIASFASRREYGLLKALGVRSSFLYRVVLTQTLISVVIGLVLALLFTLLMSAIVSLLDVKLTLQVSPASLLKVSTVSLLIAGLAAVLPVKQIAQLEPAAVFRGA